MSDYEMDFDIEGSPKHQMLDQSISEASFKSIEVEEEVKGSKESNQPSSEQFVEEELIDELPSKDSKSVKSSVAKESERKKPESKEEPIPKKQEHPIPPAIEREIEQVPVAVELKSFGDGEDSEPKKPETDKENIVPIVPAQKEPVASAVGSSRTNVQTSQSSKRQQQLPAQRPKFVQKPIIQKPPQLAHGTRKGAAVPVPAERKMQLRTTVTGKRTQQTSQLDQQKRPEGRSQIGLRTTNDFRAQSVKRPETGTTQRNSSRPFTASMQKNTGLQRNSSRKPAEAYGNQFQEARRSKASLSTKRMTQSIRETSSRMLNSSNAKERPVRQLKMADYYKEQRQSLNASGRFNSNSFQKQPQSQQAMKPVSHSFASDLLEKIIDQEAKQNNGFTLFRRGEDLKSALIDKSKVCEYIDSLGMSDVRQKPQNEDVNTLSMFDRPGDTSVISNAKGSSKKSKKPKALDLDDAGKDWGDVMSYFKNNPAALLDAIPTPREEQKNESRNFVFTREPTTPLKSVRSLQAGTPRSTQRSPKTFGFSATKRPVSRGLNTSSSRASLKSSGSQKRLNMSFQKPKVGNVGYKRQEYGLQSPGHGAKYQNIRSSGYGVSKIANITLSGSIRHLNQQETPKKQDFRINRKLQSAKQAVGNIAAAMVRQKRIAAQSVHRVKANEAKKRTEVIKANLKKNQTGGARPATTHSESVFQNDGTSSRVRSKLALQPQPSQDWKLSTLYKEYILQDQAQPMLVFDQTSNMFRLDEVEYLLNMFSQKRLSEDFQKLYEPNTKKGLSTCEFILREVLGKESFNQEFDQMAIELGGTQKSPVEARIACETTLKFCRALFQLRSQVLETLRSVKEREEVLQVMKARVMNIQNELDIGDSEDEQSRDTRRELTRIGAELVKASRKALEAVQNLLQAQNRLMRNVKVDRFVFDEADYTAISKKELSEVFDIFQAFGLQMRPLDAPHEGQRMEIE